MFRAAVRVEGDGVRGLGGGVEGERVDYWLTSHIDA